MAYTFGSNLGQATTGNSTSATMSVGANVAVGDLVIVRARGATGISDSAGNSWTQIQSSGMWYSKLTTAMHVSIPTSTITVTRGSMGEIGLTADSWTGVPTTMNVETIPASAIGTSTTPASNALTMTQAVDLVVGIIKIEAGNADTFTEDSDSDGGDTWHSLTKGTVQSSCTRAAYKVTTSSASQTYDPTLGTGRTWEVDIIGFKDIVPVSDVFPTRSRRRRVVYR